MRIKEFTSFDVAAVVRELKEIILNSRVSNIYQSNSKTLHFKLHKANSPPFALILDAGTRFNLTSYATQKPIKPPGFCMALRKYLRDAWLEDVEQHEFERVVVFRFRTKNGLIKLVLELFGEGNCILVNSEDVILQALTYRRMRDRNILRGESFTFAPSAGRNPFHVIVEELSEDLKNLNGTQVVRGLSKLLSIGGFYSEETLLSSNVDKTKQCSDLTGGEVAGLAKVLSEMLTQVTIGKLEPCIILDKTGAMFDVVPIHLKTYDGYVERAYASFNEALDEFYARAVVAEEITGGSSLDTLRREVDRLKRIIESQEKTVIEAKESADRNRHIGDLIYSRSRELQILLDRFVSAKNDGKWAAVISSVSKEKNAGLASSVLFESFNSKALAVNVCVEEILFELDLRKSLYENAAVYYERGKSSKKKLEGAEAALKETHTKLLESEARLNEIERAGLTESEETTRRLEARRIRRKEWFEKFRWFTSSDGFLTVAGKDATSNEVLVKRHAEERDIVFHSDVVGAPFVVVKAGRKQVPDQTLKEAAEFAASFSRGWRECFSSVDVYWVSPEQLSKTGPSGEFVPHGAFTVSGKRNWMRNIPLKLAVGVSNEKDALTFFGGPMDQVKAKTNTYVTIIPGDHSGREFFKHILKVLSDKVPRTLRQEVLNASIEDIREYVPYGTGRVLEEDS